MIRIARKPDRPEARGQRVTGKRRILTSPIHCGPLPSQLSDEAPTLGLCSLCCLLATRLSVLGLCCCSTLDLPAHLAVLLQPDFLERVAPPSCVCRALSLALGSSRVSPLLGDQVILAPSPHLKICHLETCANFLTRLRLSALPLPPAPGASGGLHRGLLRHYIGPPFQGGHLFIIVLPPFLPVPVGKPVGLQYS